MAPEFKSRKIKFKAWNKDARLLMRLNSIDCNKGELIKKDHILLQFTGVTDREGEEVYDMDILLIYTDKYLVYWNEEPGGWYYAPLATPTQGQPLLAGQAAKMRRFCSYFELDIQ
jgi:hypothetical protein